ncbi:glucose 1-dehydrogenase [Salinisphaera sp.]|uniref:SDR family NAD(P)-dependent oxidoreductase n=1 Tax=Salinisphaera sp. TaxID=1914330 RepID=UPI002D79ADE2|nr:glucose 1-dehydrogenase [Salinisphaera sp.]HET7314573.1 glucose 1-dehydrogenase [Salinisphaera sp.]
MINNKSANPLDLSGRTAVVVGAGGGIGGAIAKTLAAAGARIVSIDRTPGVAKRYAEDLGASLLAGFEVDIRDYANVANVSDMIQQQFGSVDILVNSAGVVDNTPAEDMTPEQWRWVFGVNLDGLFWCCQCFGRQMLARNSGVIVNIASMSGLVVNKPQPQASYNTSKAGVIMLTKSLAAEWADRGVRVNAVSPGYIGTDMTKHGLEQPAWRDAWLNMTPMGRVGEPPEIANAVWFLASDAATFATGSNLVVDGGYTTW